MASANTQSAVPVHRFILLTDIAQSSRLAEQYRQQYLEALEVHNRLVEQAVAERGGEVYKQTGDGYLVLFETAGACLDAALELGETLGQLESLAADEPLLVRLALHAGELKPSGSEYFGPALNRVSRICQVCNPGQVLLSAAVEVFVGGAGGSARGQVAGTAARPTVTAAHLTEFQLLDLGEHHLRDLAEPEQLYQLDSGRFSRHEFPPLATLNNRPNNLVEQPNSFIGRERELKELAALVLDDTRLLSITAPGGYGKSRLAAQLCANLLHRFERGAFMAYLAPVRESLGVPTAIANALGLEFSGSRGPEDQLCDYLREKELLLCLDNFEHIMDCARLVRKFLDAAPKLKIVVTSREPLRIKGERIVVLEPLAVKADSAEYTDSEQLFSDRAQLVKSGFSLQADNRGLVREICTKLSGIPLAIELAAAWMDGFTLKELNAELSQQLELESRESDAEPRHRSLKASLDWSWNLLGEKQQSMLMKLSTFRGGFFSEAASELLGLTGMSLRSSLMKLSDKGWLYAREVNGLTRFFLRDMLVLEYASEKLKESELFEPAVMAHAAYFSALLEREGPRLEGDGTPTGQLEALATIRLEQQNIDEALDALLRRARREDEGEGTAGLLLPIARWSANFLAMTAAFRELVERYDTLRRVAEQAGNMQQILLWALVGCSRGQMNLGDYEAAHHDSERATQIANSIGDYSGIALSLHLQGLIKFFQGSYDAARELFAESLVQAREIGEGYCIAMSLNGLGIVESRSGSNDTAHELFAESLAIRREIGDRSGMAASLSNLGNAATVQGKYDTARELYGESLAIVREIGDRNVVASSLGNIGFVEYSQGNYDAARELYIESLATWREIGNQYGESWFLSNLGEVELYQGNYDAARARHTESLAIRREIGHRFAVAASLNKLGIVEASQGNFDAARERFAESLAIQREIVEREGEAFSLRGLAIVHYELQEFARAEELLSLALAIRREIGNRNGICECILACTSLLATCELLAPAGVCLYGALHHAEYIRYQLHPLERKLLERTLAKIEHPETGLPVEEREHLRTRAKSMSLDELAEFALAELAKLKVVWPANEANKPAGG